MNCSAHSVGEREARRTWLGKGASIAVLALTLVGCSMGPPEPKNSSSPLRVRLMTADQYTNTLAYIFGADIAHSVPSPLPPMTRTDGLLASGAAVAGLTSDRVQRIQQAAVVVAEKVVDEQHREFLIRCKPAAVDAADAACAKEFLKKTGRLWYRHPLSEARLNELVAEAGESANRLHDFYAGLATALEGILISPEALFIVDSAEPDPENPGNLRLNAYSLAARLSFFLWNAAPDDELLSAAESGELYTEEGRERAVDTMLKSARLQDGMRAFFDDMLSFNEFDSLTKDPQVYPAETGATLADAREQTLRTIIDHLIVKKQDYRDLFTTRDTFMSMDLAPIYGVPAVDGWVPYEFPEGSARTGLLTQVSFLAAHAHPARSSATRRGKALRELFLCQKVPAPPPNVDFSKLDDPDPSLRTARARLAVHATNPSCAGCHKIMDPIGLALEHFDGAGKYRATEKGAPLDTSGVLDGKSFEDVVGLGQVLHDHPAVPTCLVNRIYGYGTGGPVSGARDKAIIDYFTKRFASAGYQLPGLLRAIALSDAFSRVEQAKQPATTVMKANGPQSSRIALNQN